MSIMFPIDNSAMEGSEGCYRDWEKSLEEEKKRLKYLLAIEKEFLATRDMRLLEEFEDKEEAKKVELAEKVKEPCTLWPEDGWLEQFYGNPVPVAIRERIFNFLDAEASLLNPNVRIRHIKDTDGKHTYRVYEGIDSKKFRAFYRLQRAELEVEQKIKYLADDCILSPYSQAQPPIISGHYSHTRRFEQEKAAMSSGQSR